MTHRLCRFALCLATAIVPLQTSYGSPCAQARQDRTERQEFDRATREAIHRGVRFLEEHGPRIPAGKSRRVHPSKGQSALVLYTILKGGGSRNSEAVNALLHELSLQSPQLTYGRGCLLMALEAHDPERHRAWIESTAQALIDSQTPLGTWSYPMGSPDLSNTQYASLGLWAASKAGVHADPAVWLALAEGTLKYSVRKGGGFSYHANAGSATGSMTTAGIGLLALCDQELSLAGRLEPELDRSLKPEREAALAWLASRFAVGKNPGGGGHVYYYMYGLERMAAFAGLARIGDHDWYREGAEWLMDQQSADGSWTANHINTCFAVLFLERATSRGRKGPVISGPKVTSAWATEERGAQVRVACKVEHGQASARVLGLSGRVLSQFVWPARDGGGLRVQRVVYTVGGLPAAVAIGSPEMPSPTPLGAAGSPAFLHPARKGDLVARVFLAPPPGAKDLPRFIESPPLKITLPEAAPPVRLGIGREIPIPAGRCVASTELKARSDSPYPPVEFGAKRAVDGTPASPWLTAAKDKDPKIRLTLKSSVPAAGLLIALPSLPGYARAPLKVPTRIRVTINGRKRSSIEVALGAGGRTQIAFAEPTKVKAIEIEIVETSGPAAAPTGLGEVSLLSAQ